MIDLFPLIKPFIHAFDAERAHTLTISAMKSGMDGLIGKSREYKNLRTEVFGLSFSNPVGLAAGFDKNADVIKASHAMGFGFAEAGTVTPLAQVGNDKPRLFRLSEDKAVINRFGFNNKGLGYFKKNLEKLEVGGNKPFGANIGANKTSDDKSADYVTCIKDLYGLSDYFTVNISSPNTPGLRSLQSREALADLLQRVLKERSDAIASGHKYIPILVKIAPDLTEGDIKDIAEIAADSAIDGLIVSNTTVARPACLQSRHKGESGGLSGAPLMEPSTKALASVWLATGGRVPLVGAGGIRSGTDAYRKIRAGASLVQLYSALVYEGPGLIDRIKRELSACLEKDGFATVRDAVGADHS
ncbi:MAG: dihydroorotate dehydrogenase (quinone) [Kordiimonadales bacterium]|nr:MAG: dihydroorotate dehydrogenase (quinone) [Kordiimonadales bacterium]